MTQIDLFNSLPAAPLPGSTYVPIWAGPYEQTKLLEEIDKRSWPLSDMARRVQHYGYRYDYKAKRVTKDMSVGPLPGFLKDLAERLRSDGTFEAEPDQIIVNEYEPGQGISAHVDCIPCFGKTIATLSMGSECEMEFEKDGAKRYWTLGIGSLLALSGEARYEWSHTIRARTHDHRRPRTRRVSITFRTVIL